MGPAKTPAPFRDGLPLLKQLDDVVEGDDQHEAHEKDKAGQMDVIFKPGGNLPADDAQGQGVDHQEENLAAVQSGQGQQVHHRQVHG